MNDKSTIEITKEEYLSLLKDSEILSRLEAGGVDNWDWYGKSIHGDDLQDIDEWEEEMRKEIFDN